jgi:hypothetical protein
VNLQAGNTPRTQTADRCDNLFLSTFHANGTKSVIHYPICGTQRLASAKRVGSVPARKAGRNRAVNILR